MDDLLQEFLVESCENLDQLDQDLVTLESDRGTPDLLARIFRTIHTIKGSCGFLGFTTLGAITHLGENLLSRLRDGTLQFDEEIATALLSLVDAVRQILANVETTTQEGDDDYSQLIEVLTSLQKKPAPSEPTTAEKTTANIEPATLEPIAATPVVPDTPAPGDSLRKSPGREPDLSLEEFLMESYGNLDQLDQDLVTLESDRGTPDLLARIFRTIHTIEGSCGNFGFTTFESITHLGENVLGRLQDDSLQLGEDVTTALLSLVDAVRQILANIETTNREGDDDYSQLIEALTSLQKRPAPSEESRSQAVPEEEPSPPAASEVTEDVTEQSLSGVPPAPGANALESGPGPSTADTNIRVDVRLLDTLMNHVGELVLARNRIAQFARNQEDRTLLAAYQRLDLITSELQEGVMKTRMMPIGTVWSRFPRVVRDLALECGKKVTLGMDGQETELDRTLIEAIRDPLTHLVRNAVDHGIEPPAVRLDAGKPETGTLALRAFHEGGQVNVEISDDGGGIDAQRIAQKAIESSLITPAQMASMNERELLNLVFAPGLSTAQTVTNVSGRGVGMDVVRNNIEKINGAIELQSEVGKGTVIKIRIPLTLAIIPALIVSCAGDRYAIPQVSLVELVRLEGAAVDKKIEVIHGAAVYRLRGNLLPLVSLRGILKIGDDGEVRDHNHTVTIVVLQADARQFGLVVDSVHDSEEIVVKPLGKQLKDLAVYAGATIMGDGKVALILDVVGLAQWSHVVSERSKAAPTDTATQAEQLHDYQTLLIFETMSGERMTLPLSDVARLERFARTDVEYAGRREVVQYRHQIMPLVHVSRTLTIDGPGEEGPRGEEKETLDVVVLTCRERSIGLVVDNILDIVRDRFVVQDLHSRKGVVGSVVVQGKVAELVDLDEIIRLSDPLLFGELVAAGAEA